jgi:hypothetical protein
MKSAPLGDSAEECMEKIAWAMAGITLSLAADLQLTQAKCETAPSVILNVLAEELDCRWEGRSGRTFVASWWDPYPPQPGGPMESVEEWKTSFLGKTVNVSRTSLFEGGKREVLVMAVELPESHAWVNLHSEGLSKEEFNAVLTSASLSIKGKVGKDSMICKKQGE